jgi:hypothetical protein
MPIRSGCLGAGFSEGDSPVAEVGDDLHAAAEGFAKQLIACRARLRDGYLARARRCYCSDDPAEV